MIGWPGILLVAYLVGAAVLLVVNHYQSEAIRTERLRRIQRLLWIARKQKRARHD